jgi:hypothetical protein
MRRILHAHDVDHITLSKKRSPRIAARCRCRCGETFYGPDRLTALDSHTAHLIAIQALDVFDLMEEES